MLSRFEQLIELESNFSITGPPPTFNARICNVETVFSYQTVQFIEIEYVFITRYEFLQGIPNDISLSECLKCDRDIHEVRIRQNGYRLMWYCQHCRRYLMKSTESVRVFMAGYDLVTIPIEDVWQFEICRFQWTQQNQENFIVASDLQQISLVVKKEGDTLKEALNGADFLANSVTLEKLARWWTLKSTEKFKAIRINDVIFVWLSSVRRRRSKETKVLQFQMNSSKLRWMDDKKHPQHLNLASIVEIRSIHGTVRVTSKEYYNENPSKWNELNLTMLIRMSLHGVDRIVLSYPDAEEEEYSKDEIETNTEIESTLRRKKISYSMDSLLKALQTIKKCLDKNGKYCLITNNDNEFEEEVEWGSLKVELLGEGYDSLRPDFRNQFSV